MSKIIKASRITGEYKIEDREIIPKDNVQQKIEENKEKAEQEWEISKARIKALEKEKEEILSKVREEVAEIKEQAVKEAEDKLEEAQKEGYRKGQEEGFTAGIAESRLKTVDLLKGLEEVIDKTQQELNSEAEKLEVDLIKLAVNIASRIVNTQFEINPELINNVIQEILNDMYHFERIHIKVNPELLNYINLEITEKEKLSFSADKSLKPGDCVVETEFGGRDGRLENKLALIEKELLKGVVCHEA